MTPWLCGWPLGGIRFRVCHLCPSSIEQVGMMKLNEAPINEPWNDETMKEIVRCQWWSVVRFQYILNVVLVKVVFQRLNRGNRILDVACLKTKRICNGHETSRMLTHWRLVLERPLHWSRTRLTKSKGYNLSVISAWYVFTSCPLFQTSGLLKHVWSLALQILAQTSINRTFVKAELLDRHLSVVGIDYEASGVRKTKRNVEPCHNTWEMLRS